MKQLIKYSCSFHSGPEFTASSSDFVVLDTQVPETMDVDAVLKMAGHNHPHIGDITTIKGRDFWISSIKLVEKNRWGHNFYLGVIELPNLGIPKATVKNQPVTAELLDTYINKRTLIVGNTGKTGSLLVVNGHDDRILLKLLGYEDFESMLNRFNLEWNFSDSVFCCDACGQYSENDDGHKTNYRVVDCEIFGLDCCDGYNEAVVQNLEHFGNKSHLAVESTVIEDLLKLNKIELVKGDLLSSWHEHESKNDPKTLLKQLLNEHPGERFIFCLDDSGPWRTYFSIYKLI